MSAPDARPRRLIKLAAAACVLLGLGLGLARLMGAFEPTPAGPRPIAWDAEPCADCHMLIGDPAYAAQLQTEQGRVFDFDDPGCLFHFLRSHSLQARAIYFHHAQADRWLTRAEVGFVRGTHTPMGYGLVAVDRGQPGARTFEAVAAEPLQAPAGAGGVERAVDVDGVHGIDDVDGAETTPPTPATQLRSPQGAAAASAARASHKAAP